MIGYTTGRIGTYQKLYRVVLELGTNLHGFFYGRTPWPVVREGVFIFKLAETLPCSCVVVAIIQITKQRNVCIELPIYDNRSVECRDSVSRSLAALLTMTMRNRCGCGNPSHTFLSTKP